MEKETKVDSFLAGLEEPNVEVGDELALFPEEDVAEVAEDAEKRIPYFKDEKVQKFIQKEIKKGLEGYKSSEQTFKEEVSQGEPKFISSLEKIIGNDTPEKIQALKDLKEDWSGMSRQAKSEALKEILEAQQEAERKLKEAQEETERKLKEAQEEAQQEAKIEWMALQADRELENRARDHEIEEMQRQMNELKQMLLSVVQEKTEKKIEPVKLSKEDSKTDVWE